VEETRMWRGRPVWAEIDLEAISHNIREIKRRIGIQAELLAVVKANGYGHGAVPVAREALANGAQRLGVACVDEGVQLRRAGITAPILILGYTPCWEAERIVQHRLTPTVTTRQFALALARFSTERGIITPAHIKVDTGMNRLGLRPGEAAEFAEAVRTLPGIHVEGIYTHFASADEAEKSFTERQFRDFLRTSEAVEWIKVRHAANSAAILDRPEMCLDMVRPGISVYGCYPSSHVSRSLRIRPALQLKSTIGRIQDLEPGETVSYGRTWAARRPSRIALVTIGYADGLPRRLSNRGVVLIQGKRAPIVGRITMDWCMADVTNIPEATLNDEVVIIGRQGEEEITADEVAEAADTISYEILCGISARVPRIYKKSGEIVAVRSLVDERCHQDNQFPLEEEELVF